MTTITSNHYGDLPDGRSVTEYVLTHAAGPRLTVLDLGATVNSLLLAAQDPASEVVVGFTDLERQQEAAGAYFGAVVGRYANRIAHGRFTLDGTEHQLSTNEGDTTLHGGVDGFSARSWKFKDHDDDSITLGLTSPDGDQGFPGELVATARYQVLADGFRLELAAVSTAPTVAALTSHLYLNLAGGGTVEDHLLQVEADHYVPIDERSIPLGRLAEVDGTPFDLRSPTRIGDAVRREGEQIALAKGIDHSFDIRGEGMRTVARVQCPGTGRRLELLSDQPALQVYTGNFLDGEWISANGQRLRQSDALALEPHLHPDSPNQDWDDDAVLRPGEQWTSQIEWHFSQ